MQLLIEADQVIHLHDKGEVAIIPATAITEISYGQDVHRRVGAATAVAIVTLGAGAVLALAKSKKHFVSLLWNDKGKRGGIAFQADKNDYRGLLMGIEGITSKKAVNSEELGVKN